jgi:hypothetical protein
MAISIDLSIFENFSFNLPISFPFEKKIRLALKKRSQTLAPNNSSPL